MKIDISKKPKKTDSVWVKYDGDVSFKIRFMSPEVMRELRKPFVNTVFKRGQWIENVDEVRFDDAINDFMIEDWKGVEFEGKPAECNLENKKILLGMSGDIGLFILDKARELAVFTNEKNKRAVKN